jgi:signal transduction histidine kinase
MMPHRKLLLFKWLMVLIPPIAVAAGHILLAHGPSRHPAGDLTQMLLITGLVTLLTLVLAHHFVESLFRVLRGLQAEAVAREQEILTMDAVLQERERLSRELHDGAAQLVAQLLLRLDTIRDLVVAGRPQPAEAELERLREIADEIYADLGESITGLRSSVREHGLIDALQDYVEQFEERHQIRTSLRADGAAERLSPTAALQLFRLVQEALTNVRKHAGAREATVTLAAAGPDQLTVVIADDGHGFLPDRRSGGPGGTLGLTSMRERVEALGGTLGVDSRPGAGTRVIAAIPLPHATIERGHAALAAPAR